MRKNSAVRLALAACLAIAATSAFAQGEHLAPSGGHGGGHSYGGGGGGRSYGGGHSFGGGHGHGFGGIGMGLGIMRGLGSMGGGAPAQVQQAPVQSGHGGRKKTRTVHTRHHERIERPSQTTTNIVPAHAPVQLQAGPGLVQPTAIVPLATGAPLGGNPGSAAPVKVVHLDPGPGLAKKHIPLGPGPGPKMIEPDVQIMAGPPIAPGALVPNAVVGAPAGGGSVPGQSSGATGPTSAGPGNRGVANGAMGPAGSGPNMGSNNPALAGTGANGGMSPGTNALAGTGMSNGGSGPCAGGKAAPGYVCCPGGTAAYASTGCPGARTVTPVNNQNVTVTRTPRPVFNGVRTVMVTPAATLLPIDLDGNALDADGVVAVAQPVCGGVTVEGCALRWQNVATDDGGTVAQCVQYCPRAGAARPAAAAPPAQAQAVRSCEVAIFADQNLGGMNSATTEDQPQLGSQGWSKQIASIQVKEGTWEFYADANYAGEAMRLAPGSYGNLSDHWTRQVSSFMCVQPPQASFQVASVSPASATDARTAGAGGRACEVAIYADSNLSGMTSATTENQPQLEPIGWSQQIASIQVRDGSWEFYAEPNYAGEALHLSAGSYGILGDRWSKKIVSFRCTQPPR